MNVVLLVPSWAERDEVARVVAETGHVALPVETSTEALMRGTHADVDIVLLDRAGGAEALRFLRLPVQQRGPIPVIAIADRRRPELAADALHLGAVDMIDRPVQAADLQAAFANAREFAGLAVRTRSTAAPPDRDDPVLGCSPAIRDVLKIAGRVAQSRCSVLLLGERGTGRETIARAIHAAGAHSDGLFLKVVCSDVDPSLFAKALDPGAPADGTVYLEDLDDLPPELQVRLETRLLTPGERPRRIIAAAQPRILDRVEKGLFRRSVLEAVSVVRIDVPTLRRRSEDVPLLSTHFLKDACRRHDVAPKTLSGAALSLLSALPWRGNVAELRALMERLSILVPRGVVLLEDVLGNVRLDAAEILGTPRGSLKSARSRFERDYVTAVLQRHGGRMGAAARELGIERTNLYRKIKQLKIQWTLPA